MNTPETWAASPDHPGYRCKTLQREAFTVCILRPELDQEERQKREGHLKTVAASAVKDYMKRKETQP